MVSALCVKILGLAKTQRQRGLGAPFRRTGTSEHAIYGGFLKDGANHFVKFRNFDKIGVVLHRD